MKCCQHEEIVVVSEKTQNTCGELIGIVLFVEDMNTQLSDSFKYYEILRKNVRSEFTFPYSYAAVI